MDREYRATLARTVLLDGEPPVEQRMREMMRLNLDWFMQTLLDRKDRMSMYNALEVRVPFCDYRIAQYLYNVPWEFKEYRGYEKGLLREAMRDYLPKEVLWRKSQSFWRAVCKIRMHLFCRSCGVRRWNSSCTAGNPCSGMVS